MVRCCGNVLQMFLFLVVNECDCVEVMNSFMSVLLSHRVILVNFFPIILAKLSSGVL